VDVVASDECCRLSVFRRVGHNARVLSRMFALRQRGVRVQTMTMSVPWPCDGNAARERLDGRSRRSLIRSQYCASVNGYTRAIRSATEESAMGITIDLRSEQLRQQSVLILHEGAPMSTVAGFSPLRAGADGLRTEKLLMWTSAIGHRASLPSTAMARLFAAVD